MALNSEQKKLLNEAHSQNEEGRDAFLAIAHTALFAASLGFIGNLIDKDPPKLIWLLIVGWSSSVIGLSALTWSFYEAKRQILRASKEEQTNPNAVRLANNAALWSFPVALLMIFLFAIINLVNIDEKEERYASPGRPATEANTREIRDRPTAVSGSQPNTDSQSGTDSDTEASVEPCGTEI